MPKNDLRKGVKETTADYVVRIDNAAKPRVAPPKNADSRNPPGGKPTTQS